MKQLHKSDHMNMFLGLFLIRTYDEYGDSDTVIIKINVSESAYSSYARIKTLQVTMHLLMSIIYQNKLIDCTTLTYDIFPTSKRK